VSSPILLFQFDFLLCMEFITILDRKTISPRFSHSLSGLRFIFNHFISSNSLFQCNLPLLSSKSRELYISPIQSTFCSKCRLSCLNLMFGEAIKFEDSQMKYAILRNCVLFLIGEIIAPVLPKR